jgi:hypothetical protein
MPWRSLMCSSAWVTRLWSIRPTRRKAQLALNAPRLLAALNWDRSAVAHLPAFQQLLEFQHA